MPFGLVNAPATFQRAMSIALRGCEDFVAVYLDDILIFSNSRKEHLCHLQRVLECLDSEGYHVRLAKCTFCQLSVPFLGHVLSATGIAPSDRRFDALSSFIPPFSSMKQLRSFLGIVMWYKSFMPHIATLAAPLFDLTGKKNLEWTPQATEAVYCLKELIVSPLPELRRFERTLATRVTTDASTIGIAAVLEQCEEDDTTWRPVAFWSRKLKDAETCYSATDLEWLAVVEAVSRVWRHFLEDIPFVIRSDHRALERKLHKSAQEPPVSARQSRWVERLLPYSLRFEYIPGKDNIVADALSRYPHLDPSSEEAVELNAITVITPTLVGILDRIRLAAQKDDNYQDILSFTKAEAQRQEEMSRDTRPNTRHNASRRYTPTNALVIRDGLLVRPTGQIFVSYDDELRSLFLSEAHDACTSGHFGIARTLERISRHWWWPRLEEDMTEYVKSCTKCQRFKHSTAKTAGWLRPIIAQRPWEIVTLDLVGGLMPAKETGHTYCMVIVDKFSEIHITRRCA